jgi:hypothetical protein
MEKSDRVIAVRLLSGSATCSAAPLTAQQREALRTEAEYRERRRDLQLQNW